MKKRLIYIFVILVVGLFIISACKQDAVGRKITTSVEKKPVDNLGELESGGRGHCLADCGGKSYSADCQGGCSCDCSKSPVCSCNEGVKPIGGLK